MNVDTTIVDVLNPKTQSGNHMIKVHGDRWPKRKIEWVPVQRKKRMPKKSLVRWGHKCSVCKEWLR